MQQPLRRVKKVKSKIFFFLKAALTALFILLVIDKVGWNEIAKSLKTIRYGLVIALVYSLVFTFLRALKWYYLVSRGARGGAPVPAAIKSYFVGMMGGLLTPGRVGEVARVVFLEQYRKSLIVYLTALDRAFDIAAASILALPGLYYFTNAAIVTGALIVPALMTAGLFFPHYPARWLNRLLARSGKFPVMRERLGFIENQVAAIIPGFKIKFLGFTFLCYAIVIVQFYWLVTNYYPCRLWMAALTQPLIMLTNIMPITIAGLGIREGAAAVLLAPFGIPRAAALSSAFMLFLLNTALPAIIGACLVFLRRRKRLNRQR